MPPSVCAISELIRSCVLPVCLRKDCFQKLLQHWVRFGTNGSQVQEYSVLLNAWKNCRIALPQSRGKLVSGDRRVSKCDCETLQLFAGCCASTDHTFAANYLT